MMDLQIIQNKIYEIRGQRVMLDFDLAALYGVENSMLKRAVRRNIERFPEDFMFELTKNEAKSLISIRVCQNGIPQYNYSAYLPFAFTEQGVTMLSSVLRCKKAIDMNIAIMRAFVEMRYAVQKYSDLQRQLDEFIKETEANFDDVYAALTAMAAKQKAIENKPRPKVGFKI